MRGKRRPIEYRTTPTGCIEIVSHRAKVRGYTLITVGGKLVLAHRAAYEAAFGPIPKGMNVCHKCDNRGCVNPDHLFLGTDADNMRDMVEKNRQAKHESHGRSKLTEEDVAYIRSTYKKGTGGVTYRELGCSFGVTETCIRFIASRRTWK